MTMTIEIPNELAAKVRAAAEARGVAPEEYVSTVLAENVRERSVDPFEPQIAELVDKPWMRYFGISADLKDEIEAINRLIEEEFETMEPEDWA